MDDVTPIDPKDLPPALKPIAELFKDVTVTTIPDKRPAFGSKELAVELADKLQGRITIPALQALMIRYGAPHVDSAVKHIMESGNIKFCDSSVYLENVIKQRDSTTKTLPRPKKEPSWAPYEEYSKSNVRRLPYKGSNTPQSPIQPENNIDRLKRLNHWSMDENRNWYLGLDQTLREKTLEDVLRKWPWLIHTLHRPEDWERLGKHITRSFILSNDFVNSMWFKQFASVVNDLRLEEAAHSLRSRIWAEGIDT